MIARLKSPVGTGWSATEGVLRLLVAATIVIPILIFLVSAQLVYRQHFAEAQARLERSIDVVFEHATKVFETLDLVTGQVDQILAGLSDSEIRSREAAIKARAEALAGQLDQIQYVLVIDAVGHGLVFSAVFPTSREVDYSGRDYFQALRSGPDSAGQTSVSALLSGRVRSNNTTFLIARRRGFMVGLDERKAGVQPFNGVIAVSTKPSYFVDHYRQIALAGIDTVTMLRADGALLARFPGAVTVETPRLSDTSAFMTAIAHSPERGSYEAESAVDQTQRTYAYRRLPKHSIYVTVGIDQARVLADWRSTMASHLVFGIPATSGLLILSLLALRRARRENIARAELAERTRERDRMWRNAREVQLVLDGAGIIQSVSPAATAALGWEPQELVLRSLRDFVNPDDFPTVDAALARAVPDVPPTFEARLRHKAAGERWLSWTIVEDGGLVFAGGHDVTADKEQAQALARVEAALRQSQKMEAVGRLTGGIAHDFNNLLTVVTGNLDLLRNKLGSTGDPRLLRNVERAVDGAQRAAMLTHRLLAFSRQSPLNPEVVDANHLVAGMSDLLARSLGETIAVETVLAGGLWRCEADPNQMESALLNLAINARDAMPGGGRLTIETANAHLDDVYSASTSGEVTAGQYVMLSVSDTGHGMSAEVRARVFEPFFTTKPVGQGTGLGLAQVYGFLRQSGGHAAIYSEPGEGTTVKLYFPRITRVQDRVAPNLEQTRETGLARGAGETVLVVEDDAMVREFSLSVLEEAGYRVLAAPDGPSALELLRAHRDEVRFLFTDVVLTGPLNGREVAEAALLLRPDLPVLFTTGYTRNAIIHHGRLDEGVNLITKPFKGKDLAGKVAAMLGDARTAAQG